METGQGVLAFFNSESFMRCDDALILACIFCSLLSGYGKSKNSIAKAEAQEHKKSDLDAPPT